MTHNSNAWLWKPGILASPGTESMAENGNAIPMLAEIDSMVIRGNAGALIVSLAPALTGSQPVSFYTNSNYPYLSVISMIAPTPDWFVGLSNFNLYNNNSWITDTTINLFVYDAGTEDGDVFSYSNPATSPQQNVQILASAQATVLANGNPTLKAIATGRIRKL
jgi:hypothetical protein